MARKLIVEIVGDTDALERSLKSATRQVDTFGARTSRTFASFGKGLAIGGVTAGVSALGLALKRGVDEFSEAQKVAAQTNAVLKSTGNVSNVTADGVDQLATSISKLSGIDDEVIATGANLILTFKNIRNEAGRGNLIFDRATRAAVNLSIAGFGAVKSTAKQLGKALNDPIRGMTALSRRGVTFTESQQKQIRSLVENNRLLEAQKLILNEVESQVGGSAKALGETFTGRINRASNALDEFLGGAVEKMGPTLERAAATGERALERISGWVRQNEKPLREIWSTTAAAAQALAQVLGPVLGAAFKVIGTSLSLQIRLMAKLIDVWKFLGRIVADTVGGILKALDKFLGGLSFLTDAASHLPIIGDKFKGVSNDINTARESVRGLADDIDQFGQKKVGVSLSVGVTGAGSLPEAVQHLRQVAEAADEVQKATRKRGVTAEQRNTFFDQALGRKLNAVQDIQALEDQLSALGRIEQIIQAQIRKVSDVTRKLTLRDRLLDVRRQAASVREQIATRFLDTLRLGLDRAAITTSVRDDIVALDALEAGIKQQIQTSGRTNDLERQLLDVARQRAAIAQQQREALEKAREERKKARDALQFKALGLSATGEERVPGLESLRRQLTNISGALEGTFLDTNKTRSLLQNIRRVLSGGLGAVSQDVRQKVAELLGDLKRQLDEFGKQGPKTLSKALDVSKALEGLTGSREALARARNALAGAVVPVRGIAQPASVANTGFATIVNIENVEPKNFDAFMRDIERRTMRTAPTRR